jgi:tRNA(fMet)-specific endonuclease VapC
MKYLLDTNICIHWIQGRDLKLRDKIISTPLDELVLCSPVKAELYYGAKNSAKRFENEQVLARFFAPIKSLPFDDQSSVFYGELRTHLRAQGQPIGNQDLMIASIAHQHQLTLVTRDVLDFKMIPLLKIEEW